MVISISLRADTEQRVERLAAATGQTVESYIAAIIERELEEMEHGLLGLQTLEAVKAGHETTSALEDVERRLAL